jgi:hypothetical protein
MNTMKGLGICVALACITFAVTHVPNIGHVVTGVTILIITTSLITHVASVRRYRNDRRAAGVTRRRRTSKTTSPQLREDSHLPVAGEDQVRDERGPAALV